MGNILERPVSSVVSRSMCVTGFVVLAAIIVVIGIIDEAVPIAMDLTQVGVGVSQVLPVLVQALLTPPGGPVRRLFAALGVNSDDLTDRIALAASAPSVPDEPGRVLPAAINSPARSAVDAARRGRIDSTDRRRDDAG